MMLLIEIACILLQVATLFVGGLMAIERSHTRSDRVLGCLIAALALTSAVMIAR